LTDSRFEKFARIMVDHSASIKAGDMVAITSSTDAEPFIRVLYGIILERGAYPHVLFDFENYEEVHFRHASDEQLDFVPFFHKMAFEQFDVLLKVRAETNTRALTNVSLERRSHWMNRLSKLLAVQMRRGASNELRWVSTIFPARAYAIEAEMGCEEYQDFFFQACYADDATPDPVARWQSVQEAQRRYIDYIQGHDLVEIHSPNADLKLSIRGRKFVNASGRHNLPDGEIYTGPVESSVNGWVRYTYPAVYHGDMVQGVELTFKDGKVVKASAEKNQDLLLHTINTDPGASYLGEFAIGTNYQIDRFTRNILLDEKIGGSFHMALGAGYPETGSQNQSAIHWDMICDIREDSEILVDGEVFYRNGKFTF
jgi:aminopeptidase